MALVYSDVEVGICYCFHYFDYNVGDCCFEDWKDSSKWKVVVETQAQGTWILVRDPSDRVLELGAKGQNVLLDDHSYESELVEAG